MGGIPYFVNGTKLYRLDRAIVAGVETFTYTDLGTIEGVSRVSMADNGTQLMILVPGGKGYIYTTAGGLVEITDTDFTAYSVQYVVFIDGYFACSTTSKVWIISNLNDGTTWDALDTGTAESDPDPIVAPVVYQNQIFMTGSETTEGFQNIGGAGFPFQRNNITLDKGCYAPFTLISTNERFFMIGGGKNESAAVWSYQGGSFSKVSTLAIDRILSGYTFTSLAEAYSLAWSTDGQYFVAFVFEDRAFIFNMTTNLWHEQQSTITIDSVPTQTRWRVNSLITAYGYTLVGDSQDGRIGKMLTSEYQEYGVDIVRVFSTGPLINGGKSFRIPRIELTMESGVGNSKVPEPLVSMALSKDAKTFGYERTRKIGKIGQYNKRIIWRKNGRFPRMCIMKFRLTDPVKAVFMKLEADIV